MGGFKSGNVKLLILQAAISPCSPIPVTYWSSFQLTDQHYSLPLRAPHCMRFLAFFKENKDKTKLLFVLINMSQKPQLNSFRWIHKWLFSPTEWMNEWMTLSHGNDLTQIWTTRIHHLQVIGQEAADGCEEVKGRWAWCGSFRLCEAGGLIRWTSKADTSKLNTFTPEHSAIWWIR